MRSIGVCRGVTSHTRKNSPSVELYGLHGLPLMYFCPGVQHVFHGGPPQSQCTRSLVNQNLNTSSIRPSSSSDFPILQLWCQHTSDMDRPRLLTWQRSPVGPGSSSILGHDQLHAPASITPSHPRSRDLPRFGRGSNSCAGSEKRTEAISVTPTNLDHYCISVLLLFVVFVLRSYPGPQVAHILAENREKSLQLGRLIGNLLRHSSRCHVLSGGGGS